MSLAQLVITLIVAGVLLWRVNNYIPMEGKIKRILNMSNVVIVALSILNTMGFIDSPQGYVLAGNYFL